MGQPDDRYGMIVPSKSLQEGNVTQLAVTPLGPNTCRCQWPLPYTTPNLGVTLLGVTSKAVTPAGYEVMV